MVSISASGFVGVSGDLSVTEHFDDILGVSIGDAVHLGNSLGRRISYVRLRVAERLFRFRLLLCWFRFILIGSFQALKAELRNRGLPKCREKAVAIRRLEASDRARKMEADSVRALNLDSVEVVQPNLTFEEAEKDRCLAEGLPWPHIVYQSACDIPMGFNGYRRVLTGWKFNASIRTIEWRLLRDLSLADCPGYEPVGDRKDYRSGFPISERCVLPVLPPIPLLWCTSVLLGIGALGLGVFLAPGRGAMKGLLPLGKGGVVLPNMKWLLMATIDLLLWLVRRPGPLVGKVPRSSL